MTLRHLKQAILGVLTYAARAYRHVLNHHTAAVRRILGVVFIVGGFLAVLPVFGLWMLPVGLALLSDDVPALRRLRRRAHAQLLAWAHGRDRHVQGTAKSKRNSRQHPRQKHSTACNKLAN